jgi:hypothetical protein
MRGEPDLSALEAAVADGFLAEKLQVIRIERE